MAAVGVHKENRTWVAGGVVEVKEKAAVVRIIELRIEHSLGWGHWDYGSSWGRGQWDLGSSWGERGGLW